MACIAALLFLCTSSYVIGRMLCCRKKQTESGICEATVSGFFVVCMMIFILQILMATVNLPFHIMKRIGVGLIVLLTLAGILILRKNILPECTRSFFGTHGGRKAEKQNGRERVFVRLATAVIFLLLVISVRSYEPYFAGDDTLEKTITILEYGELYTHHPATGMVLSYGVESWEKLNFMPALYAMLCELTKADVYEFVCGFVPVWGLLLNYAAMYLLFSVLVGDRKRHTQKHEKESGMICSYALMFYGMLLLMGDEAKVSPAFYLLHQGWSPKVMMCLTGIPIVLAVVISLFRCIGRRRKSVHE